MSDPGGDVPDTDDLTAIELAFGLLDPAARDAAEQRAADDPAFAALCRTWAVRALALLEGRERRPPARVWQKIARQLPANDPSGSVRRWQAATGVAASLALALGTMLALQPEPAPVIRTLPAARPLVAVLVSTERTDVVAVRYDPATRLISARPTGLHPSNRAAELWVIPAGGAPVSLGLIASEAPTSRPAPARLAALLVPGATLAVSLEPRGGSPTGSPTGPVILTGAVARS